MIIQQELPVSRSDNKWSGRDRRDAVNVTRRNMWENTAARKAITVYDTVVKATVGRRAFLLQLCGKLALWSLCSEISKKNVQSFPSWIPRFIIRSARPLLLTPLPSHCVREISVPAKWCEMSGKKQQQGCSRYTHWYAAELCVLWSWVYSDCRFARHFQVRRIFTGEKEREKKRNLFWKWISDSWAELCVSQFVFEYLRSVGEERKTENRKQMDI